MNDTQETAPEENGPALTILIRHNDGSVETIEVHPVDRLPEPTED